MNLIDTYQNQSNQRLPISSTSGDHRQQCSLPLKLWLSPEKLSLTKFCPVFDLEVLPLGDSSKARRGRRPHVKSRAAPPPAREINRISHPLVRPGRLPAKPIQLIPESHHDRKRLKWRSGLRNIFISYRRFTPIMGTSAFGLAQSAKVAFDSFQSVSSEAKTQALARLKQLLTEKKDEVLAANSVDVEAASELVKQTKLSESILKRLDLRSSDDKFDSIIKGIDDVIRLPDPAGQVQSVTKLDEGMNLYKVTCPIGVLLIIFEARPEVMVNIASLAVKSGNTAILKGGKESLNTQNVLTEIINEALAETLPQNVIQSVSSRSDVSELLSQDNFIDLVIPRGSKELVQFIKNNTKIPVLGHADGLCNIFIDHGADLKMATRCIIDAKTSYPAACNAVETVIVHQSWLENGFTDLALSLLNAKVTLKLDRASLDALKSCARVTSHPLFWSNCSLAKEDDFRTEWLSLILTIKTVDSLSGAIQHINTHSSHHTDSIITQSKENAAQFCQSVNSSSVYVNCSTRFADGYRYGFGTEIGISTNKIHSRGPVGLEGLVIYKWVLYGEGDEGHITADYAEGKKQYIHQNIPVDQARLLKPF
ncbi:hypothetical protein O181_021395 [Austropuccinia psidii MF-1]|uniref:glutamate-5-semialdehyde dehydrogenase n=1 Tax=Austropuccinia psidii MF-1 TaxID=1389203 RepID=A0A9Q3CFN7_9BASI|nr:hypothetical protein [Austropuccinia psidii MF-1]